MTAVGISASARGSTGENGLSRWAALSGVLFAAVLVPAVVMTSGMPQAKNAAKVQAWDLTHTGVLNGAFVVNSLGVIIGLFFLIWLHSQLTGDRASWMGNLYLVGVTIFAVSGTVAAGLSAVLGNDAKHLSSGSLQLLASFSQNFNYPMTAAGLAVMYLGAGLLIRRGGLLPGWLGWVSLVFAFLAATVILAFIALLGTVLWVISVSVILAVRRPAHG